MKRLLFSLVAMLFCSATVFAQTPTQLTQDNFVSAINANPSGSFILTEDINLGDLGTLTEAVIPTFSGTFDGDGYTITYNADFNGSEEDGKYGLFGNVTDTIKNLNIEATVTLVGSAIDMNVGLLCGYIGSNGIIEYCNVTGKINSAVNSQNGGGTDAGLVAGQCYGKISYCIVSGNVTGIGYVGGIVGQLGDVWHNNHPGGDIIACSFSGTVNADNTTRTNDTRMGSFGAGICGMADNTSTIQFCVANADITAIKACNGIASTSVYKSGVWFQQPTPAGSPDVTNSYANGNLNGNAVHDTTITNSSGTTTPNYYKGETIQGCNLPSAEECIVEALNNAIPESEQDKFYFDVINGEVVLIIGERPEEEEEIVYTYYRTKTSGAFNIHTTWQAATSPEGTWVDNIAPQQNTTAYITISTGHIISVEHNLVITNDYKIIDNNGVLKITQQGQLINTTERNVPGIVEIITPQKSLQTWTFIGAPFQTGYKLGCILPESHDVSVKKYNYSTANWSDSWADIYTDMEAGEGYFAYPFYNGVIDFTTYGDVGTYEDRANIGYTSTDTVTALNNENVEVSLPSNCPNNWMALSNPYPAKLDVTKFVGATGNNFVHTTSGNLQGECIYRLKATTTTTNNVTTTNYSFEPIFNGDIAMTEGFFVNLASGNSVIFSKEQLTDYPTSAKSQVAPREFVELSLVKGKLNSKLYFAHNQEAEQNYDIFDANKLFALGEVAEPYFVTDGIALVKEEAKELPYYATMNVRSFANDTVSFVVNNIPEGLAVSIIDGENVIDMVEGGVYTTEILTGENADRFKVLIKKSVSISDVEELEVNITNNNRHISIATTETDLQVEVYNTLGQKVLSTKDRNFTLNQVSAGAYLIKAFNNKASKTQKIVVK